MKLNIPALAVLMLLVSCVGNNSEKSTTVSDNIEKSTKVDSLKDQPESGIVDTALYMRVGDPDTALAIFVFKECYNYEYDLEKESYIRWDLEYDKLQPLVDSLFQKRSDYSVRMKQIRNNRQKFLSDARSVVVSDAREYNAISDMMEFRYLVDRKDSVLKGLIPEMLKNPDVEKEEKKLLEGILSKF